MRPATRRGLPVALRILAAALPFAAAAPALADVSLSASATSDYRYRGYSLSAERPAVAIAVSADHPSGAYLSVSAIGVLTRHDGAQPAGYQAYLGYARRFHADASWEVGVSSTDAREYYRPRYRVKYAEVYAGVTTRKLSAHLYYSPNYLGEDVKTLYGSVDWTQTPATDWRVFAHAGLLVPVAHKPTSEIRRTQYDVSAGVARRIGDVELQVSAGHFGPDNDLVAGEAQHGTSVVVGVTRYF